MSITAKHVRFPSSESLFQFSWIMWPWKNHFPSLSLHFVIIRTCIQLIWSWSASPHHPLISIPFPLAPFFFQPVILLLPCLYSCSSFAGIQCCRMFVIAMAIVYPEEMFHSTSPHSVPLTHFLFHLPKWFLSLAGHDADVSFGAKPSAVIHSHESLDLLSPTEKRSFSGQGWEQGYPHVHNRYNSSDYSDCSWASMWPSVCGVYHLRMDAKKQMPNGDTEVV